MKTTVTLSVNGKRIITTEFDSVADATKSAGDYLTGFCSHRLGIDDFDKPTYLQIMKSDNHDKFVTYGIIKNVDGEYEAKMLTYTTNEALFKSASVGDAFEYLVRHFYLAVGAAFNVIHEL